MERWQNKVAVVTGASSGIGSTITKNLLEAGLHVVGLARRVHRIEALKNEIPENLTKQLTAIKCDVSNYESVKEAFRLIQSIHGEEIAILINNAGCLEEGPLSTMNPMLVNNVLQTNVMGIVYCVHEAFDSLRKNNGHVINISSICGHQVIPIVKDKFPFTNIYSPSKYAVTGLTEVYRQEFRELSTNIKITSISPGLTDTEIVHEGFKKTYKNLLRTSDISQAIMYALSTSPLAQVHEIIIKPLGEMH